MIVYLLRHAETDFNKKHIIQGRSNPILNKSGVREAEKIREKIKDYKIDICYTSPLARSMQTAFLAVGDKCLINRDDRLLERDLGEFEGKNRYEIDKKYNLDNYNDYSLNLNDHNLEPIRDVYKRAESFLDYIKDKHKKENVLIVSHSAVIRAMHNILNDSINNPDKIDIGNCYFEVVEIK